MCVCVCIVELAEKYENITAERKYRLRKKSSVRLKKEYLVDNATTISQIISSQGQRYSNSGMLVEGFYI